MKLPKINVEETACESGSAPRKSFGNSILVATPVILTVVATVLAGLSTTEMTLAQYHRAMAAQNQSKAGDQWNFFQAKRIRAANLETTIEVLQSFSDTNSLTPESLQKAADSLLERYERTQKHVAALVAQLAGAKDTVGESGQQLLQAATRLQQLTKDKRPAIEAARHRVKASAGEREVEEAFASLNGKNPAVELKSLPLDAALEQVIVAIRERRSEHETAALVGRISEQNLVRVIEAAESNIRAGEEADMPISKAIKRVEPLVLEQVNLGRELQRVIRDVDTSAAELTAAENKPLSSAVSALARLGVAVKTGTDEINNDFRVARHSYTARRYQRETTLNKQAAELYEVQVRKSSAESERHRDRSKHFFYGMLAAQAGVTIASFSLALKHRSVLWTLASLVGIGAVCFGVYVYLYM